MLRPLVILGAGGHGKVVADALTSAGETPEGFIDEQRPIGDTVLHGVAVIGTLDLLRARPYRVALAIGDNAAREKFAERCLGLGASLATAIHPRAIVARSARLDAGVVVLAGAVVNPDAVVGRGAIINTGAIVEHDCIIGAFAHVSPNAALGGGCTVGDLAHVGIGATMLPRSSVGARSIIGGGAVVTRSIDCDVVATGVPARVRRTTATAATGDRRT